VLMVFVKMEEFAAREKNAVFVLLVGLDLSVKSPNLIQLGGVIDHGVIAPMEIAI